jgi:hypothetical protein
VVTATPRPELSAVLFVGGPAPELVTVARDPKVDGADVVYRLDDGVPGHIFEKLVDRGKVTVDCSTGLALVQPAKGGVNGTHHRGGRDRW